MPRSLLCTIGVALLFHALPGPALAGPPYITDDPEPTDTGQFENYLYVEGTRAEGAFSAPDAGFEINYGAWPDVQLTWHAPLNPNPGPGGMGIVWAPLGGGIKYRFIEEDDRGWRPQVAIFPQISIPVGAAARSTPVSGLLPLWLQKSVGSWTAFGGGGVVTNPGAGNRNYAIYGFAMQRDVTDSVHLGAEIFGQTRSAMDFAASTAVGVAGIYDVNARWHLVASLNTGIVNASQADPISWNFALKWTP